MEENELQLLLKFFKALANESRLRILGLLSGSDRSVEELAAILGLKEPTISHHLNRLKELDLVRMRADGNTHYYRLNTQELLRMNRNIFTRDRLPALVGDLDMSSWEQSVLRIFFSGDERLLGIPVSRKKRLVVLRWLANRFDAGVRYSEKEVNRILGRHHCDFATLRRELVGNNLMERDKGIYWRVNPERNH